MMMLPGQEREADLDRAVAEHELQIERREEEPGEHRRRPEDPDDVRDGEVAEAEEPEWDERRDGARLDEQEHTHEPRREREQAERTDGRPPDLVPVHDRVDGDHHRRRDHHRSSDVEARSGGDSAAAREHEEREDDDRDPDRHVDEEDPVPRQRVRDEPAEEDADRPASGRDEAEDAHRLRAVSPAR